MSFVDFMFLGHFLSRATIRFPILKANITSPIAPTQVTFNSLLLLLVASMVGIVQSEFSQGCKVTFDPVQPRSVRGCPIEFNPVRGGITQHLSFEVKRRVVKYDMQHLTAAVSPPEPLEKCQEGYPVLMCGKCPYQGITLHIVGAKHMTYAASAAIGRAVTVHMTCASIVFPVTGLKIQRTEFVDAEAASPFGTLAVKSANPPVFGPELRIIGVFPRLAMTPVNPVSPQQLTQPFQGYRRNNLLLHQVLSQLLQRPDAHPDQPFRRRKSHLANLFYNIGKEFSRTRSSTVIGIPCDCFYAAAVEPMDDLAYPCRRTIAVFGDLLIRAAAAREQDNSRMTAIDSVAQLSFHTLELVSLPGLELPCCNFVHDLFSTFRRLLPAAQVENLSIPYIVVAQVL